MSQMSPKKFVHNTAFSVDHHTLPVTPFKQKSTQQYYNFN